MRFIILAASLFLASSNVFAIECNDPQNDQGITFDCEYGRHFTFRCDLEQVYFTSYEVSGELLKKVGAGNDSVLAYAADYSPGRVTVWANKVDVMGNAKTIIIHSSGSFSKWDNVCQRN